MTTDKTDENKNGVLWSQARMRNEMRLRCHLVIGNLQLVIGNRQLVIGRRQRKQGQFLEKFLILHPK